MAEMLLWTVVTALLPCIVLRSTWQVLLVVLWEELNSPADKVTMFLAMLYLLKYVFLSSP